MNHFLWGCGFGVALVGAVWGQDERRILPLFEPGKLIVSVTEDQMPLVVVPGEPLPKTAMDLFAAAGVTPVSDREVSPPEVVEHLYEVELNEGVKMGEAFQVMQRFDFGTPRRWWLNYVEPNGIFWLYEGQPAGANRVFNLSVRAEVHEGHGVAVGGLVVPGNYARPVVIKVRGASLSQFDVTGALSDPVLRLYRGNEVILENDDWMDLPEWERETAGYLCPAPTDEKEAMIYTMLDPGPYTAIVSGKNGETGIVLLEIYLRDAFYAK